MDLKLSDRTVKRILLLGSGLVLGYCVYSGFRIWRNRYLRSIDEGFEDDSKVEDPFKKRILVLGLENAGKSTIVSQICNPNVQASKNLKPTEGFNVTTLDFNKMSINIWEIGGRDNIRTYWPNFLQDTDVLMFVVDASDIHNLSLSVKEIKWLLADERLANVPVLVIANKQDLPNAISPQQVADALDLGSIHPSKHKIKVLGAQSPPRANALDKSQTILQSTLFQMLDK